MTAQPQPFSSPPADSGAAPPRRARGFGISTKLQIAFGAVAGMTVIASAVAFLSFDTMENGLREVTDRQVPVTIDAMRLSVISRDISATAARFISARTVEDQRTTLAAIDDKRLDLATVLGRLKSTNGESPELASFVALSQQRLEANLAALEETITQRTALRSEIEKLLNSTHRIHAEIIDRLRALSNRNQELEIATRTHLLVSLISEGSIVKEPAAFKPIQDRLKAAIEALHQEASALPEGELKSATAQIARFGLGADSVFARRARELFTTTRVDATIDENVAILRDLDKAVASLVQAAEVGMDTGTEALAASLSRARTLLLIVTVASLLAAGGIGVFYVQRRLVRRLMAVGNAMRWLSSGNTGGFPPATQTSLCQRSTTRMRSARWRARCKCSATGRSNAAAMRNGSTRPRRPNKSMPPPSTRSSGNFGAPSPA